ncbi:MAG: DUF3343 domain-containing protein [Bacillota bacterium]
MVKNKKNYLITFEATYHSIKTENILKNTSISYRVISIPSVITADCGSGIRAAGDIDKLKKLFEENNIDYSAIYKIEEENENKKYIKL